VDRERVRSRRAEKKRKREKRAHQSLRPRAEQQLEGLQRGDIYATVKNRAGRLQKVHRNSPKDGEGRGRGEGEDEVEHPKARVEEMGAEARRRRKSEL